MAAGKWELTIHGLLECAIRDALKDKVINVDKCAKAATEAATAAIAGHLAKHYVKPGLYPALILADDGPIFASVGRE